VDPEDILKISQDPQDSQVHILEENLIDNEEP